MAEKQAKKKRLESKTIGPVHDLEKHLPSDWWKTLFNSVYLKTDGDVVENDVATKLEVDLLVKCLSLDHQDKILDLCCGQGRHTLALAERGFLHLTGVDRSRYLINLAKKRALVGGYTIKFSEGDARKILAPDNSFDTVLLMGNSFGYFEKQDEDSKIIKEIKRLLASKGKLAIDIADGAWLRDNFEKRSWEWIDQNHFVCRERSLSRDKTRIISREVVVHAEKGVIADQFYAERLYSANQIVALLEQQGFSGIVIQNSIQGVSSRNQDLGMMAHRLFLTATAPVKIDTKARAKKKKEVVVLMGDPSIPDPVKKNGVFNQEDFETIEKLKQALSLLDGYSFKYINNHLNLFDLLERCKPNFVFNLCDEGFKNDAKKELHIPALLEMRDMPYSGAAPACLAICYNKSIIRSIAAGLDVPVPEETYYEHSDQAASLPSTFPALIKPNFGDSSMGITQRAVVENARELIAYIEELKQQMPDSPILIQEFLSGPEYSVSIIGNPDNYTILPVLRVDYGALPKNLPCILGYESKWLPNSPYWNLIKYEKANLHEDEARKLIDYSIKLFERTGCRDYARFDFRADANGVIKLLEVNPNPGWCWDGKLNLMAGFGGISYVELLKMILDAAVERCCGVNVACHGPNCDKTVSSKRQRCLAQ